MSTHNICFHGEKEKYWHFLDEKQALAGAKVFSYYIVLNLI